MQNENTTLPPRSDTSSAAIEVQHVQPANVPQLPAALARHPLILLITAVVTIVGSVWVVSPTDNKVAIDGLGDRLIKIEQSHATIVKDLTEVRDYLQRHLDKHDDRINDLERRSNTFARYHETVDVTCVISLDGSKRSVLKSKTYSGESDIR